MKSSSSSLFFLYFLLCLSGGFSGSSDHKTGAFVKEVCKATEYFSTCEETISSSNPQNTTDVLLAAIDVSAVSVCTVLKKITAIRSASEDNFNRTKASDTCLELLRQSTRRLRMAGVAIPRSEIDDSIAWTSAALIYQNDCFGRLSKVNGSSMVDDAMKFLNGTANITSNALSLISSFRRFGDVTSRWIPPQTERDGYWGKGDSGSGISHTTFTSPGKPKQNPDVRVCKDEENGDCFRTVQEAVDSAPDSLSGSERFVIYIMAGFYEETVVVPVTKWNLFFVGDGMGKTVITGSMNTQMVGLSTYDTATVAVNGDGFMAKDLTFQNTAGPTKHQAVAFRSDSDHSVLENVEFLGHQDTLYTHSLRQYYKSCRIAGTVDFIFGNAAVVFDNCSILIRPRQSSPERGETNTVTAQGRTDPAQSTGFVFQNCTVNGTDEYVFLYRENPGKHRNYLGRPWKKYSRTVFLNCRLEEIVEARGWLAWDGDFALSTLFYGEFRSSGPGANPGRRVSWSTQIPKDHVIAYTVNNFIQGI